MPGACLLVRTGVYPTPEESRHVCDHWRVVKLPLGQRTLAGGFQPSDRQVAWLALPRKPAFFGPIENASLFLGGCRRSSLEPVQDLRQQLFHSRDAVAKKIFAACQNGKAVFTRFQRDPWLARERI